MGGEHMQQHSPTVVHDSLSDPCAIESQASADRDNASELVGRSDSEISEVSAYAFIHASFGPSPCLTQHRLGGKIVGEVVLGAEDSSLAAVSDEPSIEPEQLMPGSRSPTPEILFVPLSPPPSHRNSRKPGSIIGPDDPRNLEEPLCTYVQLTIIDWV
jgi:hypothetical protein